MTGMAGMPSAGRRGRHRKPRPRKVLFAAGGLALAAGVLSLVRMTPEGGVGAPGTAGAEPRLDPTAHATDRSANTAATVGTLPTTTSSAPTAIGGENATPTATATTPSTSASSPSASPTALPGRTTIPTTVPSGPTRPTTTPSATATSTPTATPTATPAPTSGAHEPTGGVCMPIVGLCVDPLLRAEGSGVPGASGRL